MTDTAPVNRRHNARLRRLRVLVVDDDSSIRTAMRRLLCALGHRCGTASNGVEALHHLGNVSYDLVITDFHMPGMTGEELAGAVKMRIPQLPVFLMTGDPAIEMPAAFDGLLNKPVCIDLVAEALASLR